MKVISLLCSLLIIPLTIDYLNTSKFGIWMAITSILYLFSFCDIGLGNGLRNYMADALAKGDMQRARAYFSTAVFILSLIALGIGIASIPLVYLLDLNTLFNTTCVDATTLANVLMIAIAFSLLQFVAKNVGMVYIALQKYAINDLIILLGTVSSVVAVYVLTKTTTSNLTYIVTAFTAFPALFFILAAIPLINQYPQLKPSLKAIDTTAVREIVKKGLGFFLIQITSCLVVFGSANMFISHYCGPEQVTTYNIAFKLFNILIIFYTITISPLWSAYTEAAAKDDYEWIKRSFKRSLIMWGLTTLAGAVLLALSQWVISLWIGDSVEVKTGMLAVVFGYVSVFNLNNCTTYLINGLNKIRVQIITSFIGTLVYVACILYIKGDYGAIGIALTMAGVYGLMALVHLYQCRLLVSKKAKGIFNK